MKSEMKKLTVGDNSGCNRTGDTCTVVRTSLADIAVGEVVKIRFKGEFDITPWRYYRLEGKHFRDEFDERRGRYTGTFSRVEGRGMNVTIRTKTCQDCGEPFRIRAGGRGRTPTRCPACRTARLKKQWAQAAERQRFKKGCRRYGRSRLAREQKAARAESLAQFDKACPHVAEVVIDRGNGVRTIVRGRVAGSPWQAANTLRIAAGR